MRRDALFAKVEETAEPVTVGTHARVARRSNDEPPPRLRQGIDLSGQHLALQRL